MMKNFATLCTVWILSALTLFAEGTERSLLQDRGFQNGFHVLKPAPGARVVEKTIGFRGPEHAPAWDIAQWSSRFSLATDASSPASEGGYRLADPAKRVEVIGRGEGAEAARLRLAIDSRREYARPRRSGEPWPHLLVQQSIEDAPTLDQAESIRLRLKARMLQRERFELEGYDPSLHCAQCPLVLIVQDRNRASEGYGDFLWFSVPTYDDRWAMPPAHIAEDTADPSAKLIYNPGLAAFTGQGWTDTGLLELDIDLLPHMLKAIRTGWARGYLSKSKDIGDFRIVSFILGWEMPGVNAVEIEFSELDLRVVERRRVRE
ncbi:MAG TPA: hypothetical protein DEW46_03340 [Verrucomicrobia bacterium]|jgi:hypothetical protein|nr:hypothetical protein [Verrucomicrobiota bacterium]